jgi:hypothetical protein
MSRTSSREIRPNEESDRRSDWDGERGTVPRRDVERDIGVRTSSVTSSVTSMTVTRDDKNSGFEPPCPQNLARHGRTPHPSWSARLTPVAPARRRVISLVVVHLDSRLVVKLAVLPSVGLMCFLRNFGMNPSPAPRRD